MSLPERPAHRSYLFAPGSNPRILAKVLETGADAVVLDLEDAVAADDKAVARAAVGTLVRDRAANTPSAVHVRVNADASHHRDADLDAVVGPGLQAVRLPKCLSGAEIRAVDRRIGELETARGLPHGSVWLYPTIESAAGVLAAGEIARSSRRVAALVFGPADFAADLGLPDLTGDDGMMLARSTMVLESAAAGIGRPVDGAFTDLSDTDGLRRVAELARRLGFSGKSAIHPGQLEVLHDVFTPTPAEVERAEAVVASVTEQTATARVEGAFVDAAVVAQARGLLASAERAGVRPVSGEREKGRPA